MPVFLRLFPVLALLLAGFPALAENSRPQRIVSMNQCTDALLLLLADPERIASISFVTHQPQWTPPAFADVVRGIPPNRALAEEVIALKPDLVVTGRYTGGQAVQLLRRLGVKVVEFDHEDSFDDIRANLRRMGEAVGDATRAEAVISAFDADLAVLASEARERGGVVADLGVNGWMAGGGVLTAEVFNTAGYDTLAQYMGVTGYAHLTLEQVIAAKPDALAPLNAWTSPPSLATNLLRHPALRKLSASVPVAGIPERLLACGSPDVLEAARMLVAIKPVAGAPAGTGDR